MKKYVFFATALIIIASCSTKKDMGEKTNNDKIVVGKALLQSISLSESTRGLQQVYTITQNNLETSKNGTNTSRSLSASQWKSISDLASKLNLAEINSYPSPTTKRYSDAAMASVITIKKDGKTYSSSDFDSGNPPAELRDLYMSIQNSTVMTKGGK